MPRPPNPQTSGQEAARRWSALLTRARAAGVPEAPSYSKAAEGARDRLFRDLGYTFWNEELLQTLAARLEREGPLRWVELAAGTGYLTAALASRGIGVVATDNHSQAAGSVRGAQRAVSYGDWVEALPAREAVAALQPEAVLCAWPPLGSCLVPDLLTGVLAGSEAIRLILCIGEPGGATEAPAAPQELSAGWALEAWPECERYLVGFNDPPDAGCSNSRLLIYRRIPSPMQAPG